LRIDVTQYVVCWKSEQTIYCVLTHLINVIYLLIISEIL